MNIPTFPLPVFLLPQGITRLRIFEQRYLHMIKIATKNSGFVIVLNEYLNDALIESEITGSWVEVVNFFTSDEGILIVDVKCKSLVSVEISYKDKLNLLWSTCKPISHWKSAEHNKTTLNMSKSLRLFFEQSNDLSSLYINKFIDTPNWVISRWLELLPIPSHEKTCFFEETSYLQAQQFLSGLLSEKVTLN